MDNVSKFIDCYEMVMGTLISYPNYECRKMVARRWVEDFFLKYPAIQFSMFEFITFVAFKRIESIRKYGVVPLNHFTSDKAVKTYQERSKKLDYRFSEFQSQWRFQNPTDQRFVLSEEYKDRQRNKFFNTPEGFLFCEEYDGLLFHKEKCKPCKYNYICGKV